MCYELKKFLGIWTIAEIVDTYQYLLNTSIFHDHQKASKYIRNESNYSKEIIQIVFIFKSKSKSLSPPA